MKTSSSDAQRGFTLVEVMVALVVVALSLTGIAVVLGDMLNNANWLKESTYASWIAQNKIVELRAANEYPDADETTGTVTYANSEWSWRAVVTETGIENLWRVDVSVSRPGGDNIRTVTGFIGEPVPPNAANSIWLANGARADGTDGDDAGATD